MTRKLKILALVVCGFAVLLCIAFFFHVFSTPQSSSSTRLTAITEMEQKHDAPQTMRLKSGLTPPTNKWFSGIIFGKKPQPVYAYPLAFKPNQNGSMEFSYPKITASKNTIFAPHSPDIMITSKSTQPEVTQYDDLTFTLSYFDALHKPISETTIAHGSPFAFTLAKQQQEFTIKAATIKKDEATGLFFLQSNNTSYGLYSEGNSLVHNDVLTTHLETGQFMSLFPLPQGTSLSQLAPFAKNRVTGGAVEASLDSQSAISRYTLKTANNQPTVFASLPVQSIDTKKILPDTTYETLYGEQVLHTGNSWTGKTKRYQQDTSLHLEKLPEVQKEELIGQLKKDTATLQLQKTDSYFGGKEVYRAAQLLAIAKQLDQAQEANSIQRLLTLQLQDWLDISAYKTRKMQYFNYNSTLKGVIGQEPSFGSEEFNDHHFHYGYFIYAASILGQYDESFLKKSGTTVDALVADIASSKNSGILPKLRTFDSYTGHSWASGYSDFADGNNQESSSEATNAWYAAAQWAKLRGDKKTAEVSEWMYSRESQAALTGWLNGKNNIQNSKNFEHSLVSLRWGGKLDSATFFSGRPQAKLGIQLIPMSQAQNYLKQQPQLISPLLTEATKNNGGYDGQFGDYLAMYKAIVSPSEALKIARSLPDTAIDDGNSRTYLLAWIFSQN